MTIGSTKVLANSSVLINNANRGITAEITTPTLEEQAAAVAAAASERGRLGLFGASALAMPLSASSAYGQHGDQVALGSCATRC